MWHKVCQWLAADLWFSLGSHVSSTNKTDRHEITEILLKVALNTITLTLFTVLVMAQIVHIDNHTGVWYSDIFAVISLVHKLRPLFQSFYSINQSCFWLLPFFYNIGDLFIIRVKGYDPIELMMIDIFWQNKKKYITIVDIAEHRSWLIEFSNIFLVVTQMIPRHIIIYI